MSVEQRLCMAIAEFMAEIEKHLGEDSALDECYDSIESVLCGMSISYDAPLFRIVRSVCDKHVYLKLQIDAGEIHPSYVGSERWICKLRVQFSKRKVELLTMQRRLEENG